MYIVKALCPCKPIRGVVPLPHPQHPPCFYIAMSCNLHPTVKFKTTAAMSFSNISDHSTKIIQGLQDSAETRNHHHYQSCWHCPDCNFIDFRSNTQVRIRRYLTPYHPVGRLCMCLIPCIIVTVLSLTVAAIILATILSIAGHYTESDVGTSYQFQETRLFEVSEFFKERVGISASDHFNANATLYVIKQSPALSIKYYLSDSTNVKYGYVFFFGIIIFIAIQM